MTRRFPPSGWVLRIRSLCALLRLACFCQIQTCRFVCVCVLLLNSRIMISWLSFFSSFFQFTFSAPPVITGLVDGIGSTFSVGSVNGGDSLYLQGNNLGATSADLAGITIGGVACSKALWFSSSKSACVTPPSSCSVACAGVVVVTTALGGKSSSLLTFSFSPCTS